MTGNHTLIAFAFFDGEVSVSEKLKMVSALNKESNNWNRIKADIKACEIEKLSLSDFVSKHTLNFLKILFDEKYQNFLKEDPNTWPVNPDYLRGKEIVGKQIVVNDAAERGIHLITKFSAILTHQEKQKHWKIYEKLKNFCYKYSL